MPVDDPPFAVFAAEHGGVPERVGLGRGTVHSGCRVLERHGVGEVTAGPGRDDLILVGRAVRER